MDINMDSMQEVPNFTNRTADLQYSEKTERWTINNSVQRILDLDESHGFKLLTAKSSGGDPIVLLRVVDSENADFFTGKTPIFTARTMWTIVDNIIGETELGMEPVDGEDDLYVLQPWSGESQITSSIIDNLKQEEGEEVDDNQDWDQEANQVVNTPEKVIFS